MTENQNQKAKRTPEQRIAAAQRRADQAQERLLDTKRQFEAQALKQHHRAIVLLGEWLDLRLRQDPALRAQVTQTLLPDAPWDQECFQLYCQRLAGERPFPEAVTPTPASPTSAPDPRDHSRRGASTPSRPAAGTPRLANEGGGGGSSSSAASATS